jgi:hypothetical protein
MKKAHLFRAMMIVILVTGLFAGTAMAMPGGTWASGIKIQNLDLTPLTKATISIDLYSATGSLAYTINKTSGGDPLTADAGKAIEVYLPSFSTVGAGQYSAVVSADREVAAVVTTTNYSYGMADSYNTMVPATAVSVPYVYHNHNNWSTEIFIQNTSTTSAATVSVVLKNATKTQTVPLSIPASGMKSVDTSSATVDAALGTGFIGAATITSDVPVAVVANQVRQMGAGDALGNVMISARGLTTDDGGTKILLPSLYKDFSGASGTWRSGIKLANLGGTVANVTVTFKSDPDQPAFTGVKTVTINGGESAELYLPTTVTTPAFPAAFKGYATVTSDVAVVATVQHTNYAGAGGYGVAIGYAGFSSGVSKISLPSLYNWPSGAGVWVSGIKVQNYGSGSATFKVTFTADPDSVSKVNGTITGVTLAGGAAKEFYFGSMVMDGGGTIPSSWKGSAVVEGGASDQLVATVIHTNYGRHVANMYTGVSMVLVP